MGCFLGCFGGEKVQKQRKQRLNRASPRRQRSRVQNVERENVVTAGEFVTEKPSADLVPELGNKLEVVERPSPRKRVTFNSNITTYEHVPVIESIESLSDEEGLQSQSHSQSMSRDEDSIKSSVGSYPPNHRYHNTRESDDEAEEYGDSDLDDEDDYSDDDDRFVGDEVWSESVVTASTESRIGHSSPPAISQEVESLMGKSNARDRSDYINSVLNPVENITQWKAAKSKGTPLLLKPQKENFANFETPVSFKAKYHQEIAVDASLSNWLPSPKKTSFGGFEDRPVLV